MRQIKVMCVLAIWITCSLLFAAADGEHAANLAETQNSDLPAIVREVRQAELPQTPEAFLVPPNSDVPASFRESKNIGETIQEPALSLVPPQPDAPQNFRVERSAAVALATSLLPPHPEAPRLINDKAGSDVSEPLTSLVPPLPDAPRKFREDPLDHDDIHDHDHEHFEDSALALHNSTMDDNEIASNGTLHDEINAMLGHDEERVLAGGEVKIRKKRTFCKRCYPTVSYGYGGGGGCCGTCGGCGGGYRARPRVVKVVVQPIVARPYYGGGGRGCCNPCNVCGRR